MRGERVMLDMDLANLYGVATKVLNQAVGRNQDRFPMDFMFRLTKKEKEQVVTICDHLQRLKFSAVLPYAFTEYGAIMLASVLNTPRAVQASIGVVRVFVRLRQLIATHQKMAHHLFVLEQRIAKNESDVQAIFKTIRELMAPPEKPKREIGFHVR